MRIEQLHDLIVVSKTRSISLASESLHVAQQSLSKSLKNLEDELETTLLERTSKGVYLTPDGEKVCTHAEKIIQQIQCLRDDVLPEHKKNPIKGTLAILSTPCLFTSLAPKLISAFYHDFPEVNQKLVKKFKDLI